MLVSRLPEFLPGMMNHEERICISIPRAAVGVLNLMPEVNGCMMGGRKTWEHHMGGVGAVRSGGAQPQKAGPLRETSRERRA